MLHGFLRTLVKVVVASLIVGTILAHFGITTEQVIREFGLSQERIVDLARQGVDLGAPQPAARLAGDRAGLVPDLSVPPAAKRERVKRVANSE